MRRTVRITMLFIVTTFACMIQSTIAAEAPIVIRISHQSPVASLKHKACDYFAKQLAERTKGRVKVDVYPSGMLYKDSDITPAVRDGALEMGLSTTPMLQSFIPIAELTDLPFVAQTDESVKKMKYGKPGQLLVSKMEQVGLKHVFWFADGWTDLVTAKKQVRKPADLKGLKIRVVGGTMTTETFKAFGASPVFITSTEAYMALSKGAVDGLITSLESVDSRKFYEIAKYLARLNLYFANHPMIMNMKLWQTLPNDIKTAIQEVGRDTEEKSWQWYVGQEQELINGLKGKGMTVYSPTKEEKSLFVEAVQPVWEAFAKQYGKEGEDLMQWIRANSK